MADVFLFSVRQRNIFPICSPASSASQGTTHNTSPGYSWHGMFLVTLIRAVHWKRKVFGNDLVMNNLLILDFSPVTIQLQGVPRDGPFRRWFFRPILKCLHTAGNLGSIPITLCYHFWQILWLTSKTFCCLHFILCGALINQLHKWAQLAKQLFNQPVLGRATSNIWWNFTP